MSTNMIEEHLDQKKNFSNFEYFILDYKNNLFTYNDPDKIVLIIIYIPVFMVALVGNLLVLVMVCVQRSVRRNVANRFLVNLAVADLLVTIVCIPLTVSRHIYTPWLYGEFLCRAMGFLQGIYVEGSVLTIVCMSAERYIAIRHPMRIRTFCNIKRITQAIIFTWITAVITMIPLVIYRQIDVVYPLLAKDLLQVHYCLEQWPSNQSRKAYNIFLLFIVYIIPGIIVVVLYARIGCSLWRQDHELQRANSCISNDARVMGSRRKLARMMIVVSLLFAICWMPYFILLVCSDFIRDVSTQTMMNSIYPFALLLGHSNSAQNPILYCFMHKGFHNFVRNLVSCRCDQIKGNSLTKNRNSCSSKNRTLNSSLKNGNKSRGEEKSKLMVQVQKHEINGVLL